MAMSRVLVILPRDPSVATSHVVAGLGAAARAVPEVSAISAVRRVEEVLDGTDVPLDLITSEILLRSQTKNVSGASSRSSREILDGLVDAGVRWLIYVGGKNETLDALAMHEAALEMNLDIGIQVIPDDDTNSLGGTDHCLGYGSFAQAFANWIVGEDFDNLSFFNGIKIIIAPGRETGWISLASTKTSHLGASRTIPNIGPHLVCVPEQQFVPEQFVREVATAYAQFGRATIVVSEGVASQVLPAAVVELSRGMAALQLSEYLMGLLRDSRESFPELEDARMRSENVSVWRQSLMSKVSDSDKFEAYWLAVDSIQKLIRKSPNGVIGLQRLPGQEGYQCEAVSASFETAIYRSHELPASFFQGHQNADCHQAFARYLRPLWACTSNWKEDSKVLDRSRAKLRPALAQLRRETPEFELV